MSYSGVKLELYQLNEDGTYGGLYQFMPSPLLDISRETFRTNDGRTIGGGFNLTLNGTLLPSTIGEFGSGSGPAGHEKMTGKANVSKTFEAKDALTVATNMDLPTLKGTFMAKPASGTGQCPERIGIYANDLTIQSIDFSSPDQWTNRVDYTIEMFCPNSITIGSSTSGTPLSGTSEYTFGDDKILGTLQSHDVEYSVSVYDRGASTSLTGGGVEKTSMWFQVQVQQNLQQMMGFAAQQGGSKETAEGIDRAVNAFLNLGQTNKPGLESGTEDFGILKYDTSVVSGQTDGSGISGVGDSAVLVDRVIGLNLRGGNSSITDTYVGTALAGPTGYMSSGISTGLYIDKYDVNLESSRESAIVTVTVDGEIEGLEAYNEAGVGIGRAKAGLAAASVSGSGASGPATGASGRTISPTIFYNRAVGMYKEVPSYSSTLLALEVEPISQSVGYNISEATVTYSFTYSNRPTACYEQALSENISLTKSKAVPVTASHVILGRANGPLFQDIGTQTASTTDLTVEAFIVPSNLAAACTGDLTAGSPASFYNDFVTKVQQGIEDEYDTYYVTSDSETYDPVAGRYTRNISWVHTEC